MFLCSLLNAMVSDKQSGLKSQLDGIQLEADKVSSVSADELKALREDVISLLSNARQDPDSPPAYSLDDVSKKLGSLQLAADTTQRETRILQQLHFREMFSREDNIENANDKTFNWILMPEDDDDHPQYTLHQGDDRSKAKALLHGWLTTGSGILHLSGKAGAGKSTLMKLLYNHPRTKELLGEWAGDKTLVCVPFFFWNSGSKLQMSLQGLYRSLLYKVLSQCPVLIPEVLPDQWRTVSFTSQSSTVLDSEMFRDQEVKDAFGRLMKTPVSSDKFKFCFFIDGLDEYEAHKYDQELLAVQLRQWTRRDNLKICASSRPHLEFMDTFPSEFRLELHQLTAADIWRLGCDMFESDANFDRIKGKYRELVYEIVKRAEGVLLWARLVLKTVVREVGLHSTHDRLREKIRTYPREMGALYDKMLSELDAPDERRAYLILYLTYANLGREPKSYVDRDPLRSIILTWLDDMAHPTFPSAKDIDQAHSKGDLDGSLAGMERQLSAYTRGLLHVAKGYPHHSRDTPREVDMFRHELQMYHRTVRDYLDTASRRKHFEELFPGLDLAQVLSRVRVAELCLASNPWSRVEAKVLHDRRWEFLTRASFRETYWTHHTAESMKLFYDRLGPSSEQYFQNRVTQWGFTKSRQSTRLSAIHHAAWSHLNHYVERELGAFQTSELQAHTPPAQPNAAQEAQDLSLLFSAACGTPNPKLVTMLLDAGFSTQIQLHLFRISENRAVHAGQTVSFWMAWVANHAAFWHMWTQELYMKRSNMKEQAERIVMVTRWSEIMELLLRAGPLEEVVVLTVKLKDGARRPGDAWEFDGVRADSLRRMVRFYRPPNMNRLLDLLPHDSPDPGSWPHVNEFRVNWRGYWAKLLEGRKLVENFHHYLPDRPILGVVVAVASRSEIWRVMDHLNVRLW